jgi:hypothetical protein
VTSIYGISSYLRKGTPLKDGPLGGILLKAAGVPHEITPDGGVVPAFKPLACLATRTYQRITVSGDRERRCK